MFNLKKAFGKFIKSALGDALNDGSYSSMSGGGLNTPFASNMTVGNMLNMNKNWVFACVNKIATAMSGIELELRQYDSKGNDVEIEDHKVLTVLRKPNKLMTGRDFMYTISGHLQLTGNAYILKNSVTNPTELFPLVPSCIEIEYNANRTGILGYKYTIGGKSFKYDVDEIVHLKKPNLKNPWVGAGILEHIPEWIDVDSAALEFNRLFFKNGASLGGLLETEATTMKELELAKAGFEMRYAGVMNAHKTGVLSKGVKYTSTSANPRDMQFAEMDIRFRDKILSAFGIPKSVLGIVDDVNRANAEASYFVFMMFTIDPEMKMLVAYLNEYLLPSFTGTEKLYFDYDNIIPDNDDLEIRQNTASLAGQSWKTINEVRASEGLEPIENGDFVYGGFATVPIGKPIPQTVENSNSLPIQKNKKKMKTERIIRGEKIEKGKKNIIDDIMEKVEGKKGVVAKTVEEIANVEHKKFITRVTGYENKFIKATKDFDKKIEEQVLESLDKSGKDFMKKDLFDVAQARTLFIGFTSPILQDLLKTEGQAQMARLNTSEPFNPLQEGVQEKVRNLLKLTAGSYTETTFKLLNSELQQGIDAGESLPELRQRVSQVFNLTDAYRAERVARTTVFGTANNAAREAYKQSGVVKTVVWHTAEDEMTCEFCEPMNGKTIDIDGEFFEKGDTVHGSN